MPKDEIQLMIKIIENLNIYVSDDDKYEMNDVDMPKDGYLNFKKDVENLYKKLRGIL